MTHEIESPRNFSLGEYARMRADKRLMERLHAMESSIDFLVRKIEEVHRLVNSAMKKEDHATHV